MVHDRAVLMQDAHATKGGRNLDKRLCFGVEDFRIGTFIFVYGRHLFLYDCDSFTRDWYQARPSIVPDVIALGELAAPP